MRSTRLGNALWIAVGWLALPATALAGGSSSEVLQGSFVFNDSQVGSDHCATINLDGTTHDVTGFVSGVGLSGDTVTLTYFTPFVDGLKAKRDGGKVQEREQSQLDVDIQPGAGSPTAAYTGTANPEKASVTARTNKGGLEARIKARYPLGSGFSELEPDPDADQQNTILAAFENRDDVKIQQKNGRVRLRQDGLTTFVCPPVP